MLILIFPHFASFAAEVLLRLFPELGLGSGLSSTTPRPPAPLGPSSGRLRFAPFLATVLRTLYLPSSVSGLWTVVPSVAVSAGWAGCCGASVGNWQHVMTVWQCWLL